MTFKKAKVMLLLFVLTLFTTNAWAMDEEDDTDSEQDAVSQTDDSGSGSAGTFAPPHDDHSPSTPSHPDHASGASAAGKPSLAETASDPSAILTMMQMFFWTTGNSDDNNIANTFLLQPVLPLTKANVFRPALPVVNTSAKTGIGDLFLLDLQFFPLKSGTFGIGAAASVPIGVDEFTTDKWEAGPSVVYINKAHPGFIAGVLAYNTWSFAGKSRAQDVNKMTIQPIYVKHQKWGYWGWTDQTVTVDWENNLTSVPLGLRFGNVTKVFGSRPVKIELGFYYTLNNKNRDNTFGLKFQFSPIFPELLNH